MCTAELSAADPADSARLVDFVDAIRPQLEMVPDGFFADDPTGSDKDNFLVPSLRALLKASSERRGCSVET